MPKTIPTTAPPNVVTSRVTISGAGSRIEAVKLTTGIVHTASGDLDITLKSPAGTLVTITSDNGDVNDNVFNGTLWDDKADPGNQVPFPADTFGASNLATDRAYANLSTATPLVSEEALAAFRDENPNGVWELSISDDTTGNGGTLNS